MSYRFEYDPAVSQRQQLELAGKPCRRRGIAAFGLSVVLAACLILSGCSTEPEGYISTVVEYD